MFLAGRAKSEYKFIINDFDLTELEYSKLSSLNLVEAYEKSIIEYQTCGKLPTLKWNEVINMESDMFPDNTAYSEGASIPNICVNQERTSPLRKNIFRAPSKKREVSNMTPKQRLSKWKKIKDAPKIDNDKYNIG